MLFVLPQSWTDAFIPMNIEPQPRKIVRVMVGRLEMLSADRQRKAEAAIAGFASGKPGEVARAYRFLYDQGRYLEPIVRHVAKTTRDEKVKALCGKLLLTDFVTDLRAALHNASDGKPLNPMPSRSEPNWRGCCARWARMPRPRSRGKGRAQGACDLSPAARARSIEDSPAAVEIKATALEGSGDDGRAAEAYARRVELAARSLTAEFLESQISGMRDWWIGRAYAACALRSGRPAAVESTLRAQVARPARRRRSLRRAGGRGCCWRFCSRNRASQVSRMSEWRSMITKPGSGGGVNPAPEPTVSAKTGI